VVGVEAGAEDLQHPLEYLSEEIVVGVEAGAEDLQHPLEYLSEEIVVGVEAGAEDLQHPLEYLSKEIVVGVEAGAEDFQHPLEYLSEEIVVGVEAGAENLQHPFEDVVVGLAAQVVLDVALRLPQHGGDMLQGHQAPARLTSEVEVTKIILTEVLDFCQLLFHTWGRSHKDNFDDSRRLLLAG
jgi:hypothetical protein